jgi:hypothetical protein
MSTLIVLVILAPAVLSIGAALYYIIRWIFARRGSSTSNELLVGVLGPFSLFAPKLMDAAVRIYLLRFYLAMSLFVAYCGLLLIFFGK